MLCEGSAPRRGPRLPGAPLAFQGLVPTRRGTGAPWLHGQRPRRPGRRGLPKPRPCSLLSTLGMIAMITMICCSATGSGPRAQLAPSLPPALSGRMSCSHVKWARRAARTRHGNESSQRKLPTKAPMHQTCHQLALGFIIHVHDTCGLESQQTRPNNCSSRRLTWKDGRAQRTPPLPPLFLRLRLEARPVSSRRTRTRRACGFVPLSHLDQGPLMGPPCHRMEVAPDALQFAAVRRWLNLYPWPLALDQSVSQNHSPPRPCLAASGRLQSLRSVSPHHNRRRQSPSLRLAAL